MRKRLFLTSDKPRSMFTSSRNQNKYFFFTDRPDIYFFRVNILYGSDKLNGWYFLHLHNEAYQLNRERTIDYFSDLIKRLGSGFPVLFYLTD